MNTDSKVDFQRVRREKVSRFNPLRSLNPQTLGNQLDEFARGRFYRAAQTFDAIERRDYSIRTVASKRKRAVGRHGWEILTTEESAAADAQKEFLEDFWNNIRTTHALKPDMSGGWGSLCEQMLDAVGKGYAAHELLWEPSREGLGLNFNFVPLWFFEAEYGPLRFLNQPGATLGTELEEDAWMVTVGDGLMEAAAVCYMFKRLPLQDWLGYSEKFGFPWPHMETTASFASKEWDAAVDAMANFLNDGSIVTSEGQKITLHEVRGQGPDTFQKLIEAMDRACVSLWRGSDLSTMSAGDSVGASVQEEETQLLEADDALLIEDTLTKVSRIALRWKFGRKVQPLVYLHVLTGGKTDDKEDLEKWKTGAELGVKLSAKDFRERFSLPAPEDDEELLTVPTPSAALAAANVTPEGETVNEQLMANAQERMASAFTASHRPLATRMREILALDNEADFRAALTNLKSELPGYLNASTESALTRAFEESYAAAAINGAAEDIAQTESTAS